MDWFKRYGIPGAYSMGLTLVWLIILYPYRINLSEENTLKIAGGIFAGGFLPFGYLMCMVGQGCYFFCCSYSNRFGRHARAESIAKDNGVNAGANNNPVDIEEWAAWAVNRIEKVKKPWLIKQINRINKIKKNLSYKPDEKETVLSACSVLEAVSRYDNFDLDKEKFVQEWIRKRTDIVVMNQAIMSGTIVCTIGALCLASLPDWSIQLSPLIWLLIPVLFFLFIIIWYVKIISQIDIDIAIAGVFNLRRRYQRAGSEGLGGRESK